MRFSSKLVVIIVLVCIFCSIFTLGIYMVQDDMNNNSVETGAYKKLFTELEFDEEDIQVDAEEYTYINLSDYKGECIISDEGDFWIQGDLDGSVIIDSRNGIVHLYLDDVSISSNEGPALNVVDAEKVIITLVDDTDNILSDSGYYTSSKETAACIYSVGNLTFNGKGNLTINGYYKDAVCTKDILKIYEGNYSLKCKNSAFRANDGIHVSGGSIEISSEKIGFETRKKGGDGKGNIVISGGNINLVAGEYAFVTEKADLYIFDCTIEQHSIIGNTKVEGECFIQEGCVNE